MIIETRNFRKMKQLKFVQQNLRKFKENIGFLMLPSMTWENIELIM